MSTGKITFLSPALPAAAPAGEMGVCDFDPTLVKALIQSVKLAALLAEKRGISHPKALDDSGQQDFLAALVAISNWHADILKNAEKVRGQNARRTLAALLKSSDADEFRSNLRKADSKTQGLIMEVHLRPYREPWRPAPSLASLTLDQLRDRAREAEKIRPTLKAGRHQSGIDMATIRQLAKLWLDYTGLQPTHGPEHGSKASGPFPDFVNLSNKVARLRMGYSTKARLVPQERRVPQEYFVDWRLIRNALNPQAAHKD